MNQLEQRQDRLETQLDILTNGLIKANQEITKLKRDRDDLWYHVSEEMKQ